MSAGLAIVPGLIGPDRAMAAEQCYANWSEAAPVVAKESLVSARDIHKLVGQKIAGKVVRITLCRTAKGYEYRLVVFGAGRKAQKIVLDARRPVVH